MRRSATAVRPTLLPLLLLSLSAGCTALRAPGGPAPAERYPVVPAPAALEPRSGELRLDAATAIHVVARDAARDVTGHAATDAATDAAAVAELLAEGLRRIGGPVLAVAPMSTVGAPAGEPDRGIILRLEGTAADSLDESYRLDVTGRRALVAAASPAGLFRGTQTLLQLVAPTPDGGAAVPAGRILDAPRFPYRGMHLDVGRHFFPPASIKKYIDLLALYRFNVFHWHLTEDQGWRIEIEAYPRLTEVGAWRAETTGDGTPYGGHYTKEEIRGIVAYAAERHITIIPEIEMPGHALAALAAYPELACTEGPFDVGTRWGVFEDILCPHERTFAFLETVLAEVMALFPSRYIHIGGDEAPKRRWRESPAAQEVMRREGLADEDELQSWFIQRIERFLNAHDRRLIGWDEILEGGLAPNATVMSWRGMAGGIEAARQGRDVVMTPTSHAYFDYLQGPAEQEPPAFGGFLPLEQVYAFEPVPEALTPAEASHVLGAQGNVWTEYMTTWEHVEYMVLPRLLALAEVVWSRPERRDWSHFLARLPAQFARLDALGYNYRVPDVRGLHDALVLEDAYALRLGVPVRGALIRYTLDGTEPTSASTVYTTPVRIPLFGGEDAGEVVITARAYMPDGRTSALRSARVRHATLRDAERVPGAARAPGLRLDYMEGEFRQVAQVAAAEPVRTGETAAVELPEFARPEHFGLRFTGWIAVPRDGVYTFHLTSDDGSTLSVGGEVVVDHDGLHGPTERSGQVALRRGLHALELLYFQAGGGRTLTLEVTQPDGERTAVPAAWWWRPSCS